MPTPELESFGRNVILPADNNWEMDIGMERTGVEAQKVHAFIRLYRAYFAFKLTDLERYKGKPVGIQLKDDHPIFRRP